MPVQQMTPVQLTKELKKSKRRPMHYQFAAAGKDGEHFFLVSMKPLPPRNLQVAKRETGSHAIGGTVRIEDEKKQIVFETENKIPSRYDMILRKYLKELKLTGLTVVVRAPGAGDEDDGKKKKK